MREKSLKVLIIGGYGVFGGRLAELLSGEAGLTLQIAGRSLQAAKRFCADLGGACQKTACRFDRDGEVAAQMETLSPDIVVDATGPFQTYGADAYRVVQAAIDLQVNYIDLADGSDFALGVEKFDAAARQNEVFVLSAASSFPVLTAAVVRHMGQGLPDIETITGGIAPSPFAGVGLNVIRAISSYAGQTVKLVRSGRLAETHGLTETERYTICPPGRDPLPSTLFSLVDVPDLQILPRLYPELNSAWMGAGPRPEILHRALIVLARLVKTGLLPSLLPFAKLFQWVTNTLRWGPHRGGMYVRLSGKDPAGASVMRSWHMLAEGDDGPYIPSMAAQALILKVLSGRSPVPGARSAENDLELADYDKCFAGRAICHGVRDDGPGADSVGLYPHLLGAAFDRLPAPLRSLHGPKILTTARGTAHVERGSNLISRLIGAIMGFPQAAETVPVTVEFQRREGIETWTRDFGGKRFTSRQYCGRGRSERLLVEQFGPVAAAMALIVRGDRLYLEVKHWSVLGLPLPLVLAPGGTTYEHAVDGRFHFNVEIILPLVGLLVRYKGHLVPDSAR